jgi:DeoR/GlpR family transcriptional regulator of sugar metabolism
MTSRQVDVDQRQRRELIRRRVLEAGHAEISDLARELGVSVMTIHRDLDALQEEGWLRKIRGGATARPSSVHHGDVSYRLTSMAGEKDALARTALELIAPGATVALDDSTTALGVANLLAVTGGQDNTVITNFFPAMRVLGGQSSVELIGLGGTYFPAYDAFLGIRTIDAVRTLRAEMLFMSTTAVTNGCCYHQSQETVAVKRALMEAVNQRVLMLDHSKFARSGLHRLADLCEFDIIIVDDGLDPALVDEIGALGPRVLVATTTAMSPAR